MARKRWTIDKDGNAVQVGAGKTGDSTKDAAWDKVLDAEEKLLEDFKKKLITADELQQELKQLIQDSRKALGITVEQMEKRQENLDSGIDKFDKDKLGGKGLTSEAEKRAKERFAERRQQQKVSPMVKSFGLKQRKVDNRASQFRGYGRTASNLGKLAGGSKTQAGRALGAVGKGLSKAAGPAAIVYEVADKIADSVVGVANRANKIMESAGKVVQGIAGNNVLGAFNEVSSSVQNTIKKMGPMGKVYAAALGVATTAINVFTGTVNAFNNRARELMGYGGANTTAIAMADVNKLMADIREAQSLDKEYADIVKSQGKISANIQDALIPIKRVLMRMLAGPLSAVETVSNIVAYLSKSIDQGVGGILSIREAVGLSVPMVGILDKLNKTVEDAVKSDKDAKDADAMKMFDAFITMDPMVNDRGGDAVAPERGRGIVLGIPRFAGP